MIRYGVPLIALTSLLFASVTVFRMAPVVAFVAPPVTPPAPRTTGAVAAVGLIEPSSENVAIAAPVAALVLAVRVKPGDRVRANDPLFQLDDRSLTAELAVRRSGLALAEKRLARLQAMPRAEDLPPLEARVRVWEAELDGSRTQLGRYERAVRSGAASEENVTAHRTAAGTARAHLEEARAALAQVKAGAWSQELAVARAELEAERARVQQAVIELDRLTVRAPIAGEVLQVKVRAGEYAPAAQLAQPLVLLGATDTLHVRAAVDEHDAARVAASAPAEAMIRGEPATRMRLRFVRFEPYVLPKVSLTNSVSERVDTRVLEVIYALAPGHPPVHVGHQVDVFIEVAGPAR